MDGLLLRSADHSIFLHPPEAFPDDHGFHHRVDFVAGPFQGAIDATSYESVKTLRRFHDELTTLYRKLKGEAHLGTGYENLTFELKGDGKGHFKVDVAAWARDCMDTRLNYAFTIDQTQLPAAIASLAKFAPL
jgi:hypothetical protein